jgi:hypothetical protein
MAIQFACPGCHQPIEVDDQHAGKMAACPYCRQVVGVPQESTYRPEAVPAARPAAGGPSASATPEGTLESGAVSGQPVPPPYSLHVGPTRTPRERAARTHGTYALICVALVVLQIAVLAVPCAALSISKVRSATASQPLSPERFNQVQTEVIQELQAKPWFYALSCGSEFFTVIGLALAIASVVQSRRQNWPGIVALIASGLLALCFCGTAALQFITSGFHVPT